MKKQANNNSVEILINKTLYPIEAVYGASYVFVDKFYLYLDMASKDEIRVSLKAKEGLSEKELESARGEFLNELLNYSLRLKISDSNKKIKELIVGQALVASINCEDEGGVGGGDFYEDDPLGIAVPWEDKYKKGEK